jgi:hypothetical protein
VEHTVDFTTNVACVSFSSASSDYQVDVRDANGDRFYADLYIYFLAADGSRIRTDRAGAADWDPPRVDDAAHTLWLITSFDAFDLLYTGRGLPVDEVARLLIATAERAVCR